jgi:hypothetical protein
VRLLVLFASRSIERVHKGVRSGIAGIRGLQRFRPERARHEARRIAANIAKLPNLLRER